MNFKKVIIYTHRNNIDILTFQMLSIDINGFVIEDSEDFREFLEDKNKKWDYIDEDLIKRKNSKTNITVYLPDNEQGRNQLISLKEILKNLEETLYDFHNISITIDDVKEEDWENNWKQYFKPLEIGENLVVKPSWEIYENKDNKKVVEIDPHSSFGTGQHETTKFCMQSLERVIKNNDVVLDLGCGSGILSITCLLLGAKHVTGVDIEELSIETSIENIANNHIPSTAFRGIWGNPINEPSVQNLLLEKKYDVVVANIVADAILLYSNLFVEYIKIGGALIVSGIIAERVDEIEDKLLSLNFVLMDKECLNDWYCLMFTINETGGGKQYAPIF